MQEDEDRRRAESMAEELRLQEEKRKQLEIQERERQRLEAAEREWQRLEAAERERQRLKAAERERQRVEAALHTQVGRWLKLEAHFDDTRASRFCDKLQELGFSSTQGLMVLDEEDHRQLAQDLNMNKWVPLPNFVSCIGQLGYCGMTSCSSFSPDTKRV